MYIAHRPVVLMILDGWGFSENPEYNAIAAADTPNWDQWQQTCPHTLIDCSGEVVGLPKGQMGNSEVGHMHIGAGRLVDQDLTRIDKAIADGSFFQNPVLNHAVETAKAANKKIHLIGLVSPGGVHSHESHFHAMIDLCVKLDFYQCVVHAILDGRDTPPRSAEASLVALQNHLAKTQCGSIGSIIGRYYAMDRDKRWDRIQQAYDLITQGKAEYTAADPIQALQQAYQRNEGDEFVKPTWIDHATPISNGDVVIFMNFRADRARQLTRALTEPSFTEFNRKVCPLLSDFVTLTEYANNFEVKVAFEPQQLQNSFGEYIAGLGLRQLRIAETEKYAHVTFFFNGGREHPFKGEDRILVPSPQVATYDLQPEMSAPIITEKLILAIKQQTYDVIICNLANADMVGHSGNFAATCQAVHYIDECLGKIAAALAKVGGEMIITADHGNAEFMFNQKTEQAHTAHTTNVVPFVYIGRKATVNRQNGLISDVAPTLLSILGLPQPAEMTGQSLLTLQDS